MSILRVTLALIALLLGPATSMRSEELGERGYRLAATERDAEIEAAILKAFPDYNQSMVDLIGQKARYLYNRIDLDADGADEVAVYLLGRYFCGSGGCSLLILREGEVGLELVNNLTTSRVPLVVRPEKTRGWHDLVRLSSGGGAAPAFHRFTFDGKRYVAGESVPSTEAFEGTSILADDLTAESGIVLEPR